MDKIEFKSFYLFLLDGNNGLEYKKIDIEIFKKLEKNFIFNKDNTIYEVETLIDENVWIYIKYGSNKPYTYEVINIKDFSKKVMKIQWTMQN